MEAMVMSWAKQMDDDGQLQTVISEERWDLSQSEVTAFLSDLRPALTRLADGSRQRQSQVWRDDLHVTVTALAAEESHAKVTVLRLPFLPVLYPHSSVSGLASCCVF